MKTSNKLQIEGPKVAPEDTVNDRRVARFDWAGVNQAGHTKKTSVSREVRRLKRVQIGIPSDDDRPLV